MINLKTQWSGGETLVSFNLLLKLTTELQFYQSSLFHREQEATEQQFFQEVTITNHPALYSASDGDFNTV